MTPLREVVRKLNRQTVLQSVRRPREKEGAVRVSLCELFLGDRLVISPPAWAGRVITRLAKTKFGDPERIVLAPLSRVSLPTPLCPTTRNSVPDAIAPLTRFVEPNVDRWRRLRDAAWRSWSHSSGS